MSELAAIRRSIRARTRAPRNVSESAEIAKVTHVDPDDVFFSKIMLNLLSDFNETYSEYALLNRLAHESLLEGPWFVDLRKIIQTTIEKDKTVMGASVIRSVVGRTEVAEIVRAIFKANPHLKGKPQPRETSITLGGLLDLNELEILMLDSACRYPEMCYNIRNLLDNLDMRFQNPAQMIAAMYKRPLRDAQRCLQGMLFNAGILTKESSAPDGLWGLNTDLQDVFSLKNLKIDELDKALFPHMLKTSLTLDDYPHLEKEVSRCMDIIEKNQTGGKKKEAGVNVMLWGVPGTGKTELAIAMAKARGWNLKVIGDISPDNMQENSRHSRLTSLKLASKIFRNQPNTVLLFDEMEDLFKHDTNAQFSKAFINRIIETTDIPIIWTTNDIRLLGQPVLRRMVYNIGFTVPPEEVRLKMWEKYCNDYKLKTEQDALKAVAKTYPIAPAVIKNAVHVSSTAFGKRKVSKDDLFEIISSLDTLVNYGVKLEIKKDETREDGVYDLSCVNADTTDLEKFTDRLVNAASPGFALCLYGAPGTGKSEYGRYLAKKMGKEVLFKRASDLQSMWVGQCHSDDTEFLTNNGVKYFDEISDDDLLGTINQKTGVLEFQKPTERLSRHYTGIMKHFKHAQIDAMVTPKHRMWTRGLKRRTEYGFAYAGEINQVSYPFNNKVEMMTAPSGWVGEEIGGVKMTPSKHHNSVNKPTDFDAFRFMEFIGYYVTEGSLSCDDRKNIYLSQAPGKTFDRMLELANYVGGKAWVVRDPRGRADTIKIAHAALYDWLLENCGRYSYEKRLPSLFLKANSKQLEIMLSAMIAGDGHRPAKGTDKTFCFNLTSKKLIDQIAEVGMKLGLSARHRYIPSKGNNREQWAIYVTPRREKGVNKTKDIHDVEYDGRVVCFRVPNETLLTRRNGCWIVSGNCEKNIAEAFAEAKKKGMVLLIDEGDTFLRDREKAQQSWEVSQVNEMLSQMERHPEPFILTTNLMKDLDAASLRRFTFKLKFDYMRTDQARRLFKGFFKKEAPKELDRNPMLVPGDYANVQRQVEILGISDPVEIYRMLEEETKLKPGKRGGIGF